MALEGQVYEEEHIVLRFIFKQINYSPLLIALYLIVFPLVAHSDPHSSGQNTLHPVRRFDFRHEYVNLEQDAHEQLYILRAVENLQPSEDLSIALRLDLPSVIVDEDGPTHSGFGDILLEGLVIENINKHWRHACGIRTIIPSGSREETGGEKWDIAPVLGWSVDTPEFGHGSFTSFLMRYRFSALGSENRTDRNQLELDFDLNVHLANQWFVELTSDPVLNFENQNKWLVPVGVEFGRKIGEKFIFSFEPQVFIINEVTEAQFAVQSRIGFFF